MEAARADLPNDPRIFELTGYILRRQDKYDEGTRALEQAVALDPRNPYTLTQLSFSYQGLRRYPEAKATLERVLEITAFAEKGMAVVPHRKRRVRRRDSERSAREFRAAAPRRTMPKGFGFSLTFVVITPFAL